MKQDGQQTEPGVLTRLAQLLGTNLRNHRLTVPEKFGRGYCQGFVFNEHIRMLILNYELKEDVVVENPDINDAARTILFKFQNVFPDATALSPASAIKKTPSVLIATTSLNTEVFIPVHTHTATINVEIDAVYLSGLFDRSVKSSLLQGLFANTQPLLFEQMVYPSLQKILDEILACPVKEMFKLFFLRVKAEELVCRLLAELEKREERPLYALNNRDVQVVYQVRDNVLSRLDQPPSIPALALGAGMSPTKLKRLFSQVFGNSLFNYYQSFRMQEAARLLREDQLSVSAAGYRLGFTNMSHFSKIFAAHMGMKPKQYSRSA